MELARPPRVGRAFGLLVGPLVGLFGEEPPLGRPGRDVS